MLPLPNSNNAADITESRAETLPLQTAWYSCEPESGDHLTSGFPIRRLAAPIRFVPLSHSFSSADVVEHTRDISPRESEIMATRPTRETEVVNQVLCEFYQLLSDSDLAPTSATVGRNTR